MNSLGEGVAEHLIPAENIGVEKHGCGSSRLFESQRKEVCAGMDGKGLAEPQRRGVDHKIEQTLHHRKSPNYT